MSVPTFEELREALKCPPKIVVPLMSNGRPKSSYHQQGGNLGGKKVPHKENISIYIDDALSDCFDLWTLNTHKKLFEYMREKYPNMPIKRCNLIAKELLAKFRPPHLGSKWDR